MESRDSGPTARGRGRHITHTVLAATPRPGDEATRPATSYRVPRSAHGHAGRTALRAIQQPPDTGTTAPIRAPMIPINDSFSDCAFCARTTAGPHVDRHGACWPGRPRWRRAHHSMHTAAAHNTQELSHFTGGLACKLLQTTTACIDRPKC